MLKRLSNWLYLRTNGALVLLFLGLQMLFNLLIFPYFQNRFQEEGTSQVLDLKFGFDSALVLQLFESYGKVGRRVYMQVELFWDIIYPIIYTAFNVLFIGFLVTKVFPEKVNLRRLNLIPFIPMFFDFCENFGIILLLVEFPNISIFWVKFASTAGILKWIFAGIGISITLALLLTWLLKSIKKK